MDVKQHDRINKYTDRTLQLNLQSFHSDQSVHIPSNALKEALTQVHEQSIAIAKRPIKASRYRRVLVYDILTTARTVYSYASSF